MFSTIRSRITYANVAMTMALVFAMAGGAYAAKKHWLITSTKQIKPSVLRQLKVAGPVGPAGEKGAAGSQGAPGAPGSPGKDGLNGEPGKTGPGGPPGPTGAAGAAGSAGSAGSAGATGATGPAGTDGKDGATGAAGATGPEGVCSTSSCHLPANVTETGQWSVVAKTDEGGVGTAISFAVPLAASLETSDVHFIGENEGEGESKPAGAITSHECEGTYKAPAAASKQLCVFTKETSKYEAFFAPIASLAGGSVGADTSGAQLLFIPSKYTEEFVADGSWAVTG